MGPGHELAILFGIVFGAMAFVVIIVVSAIHWDRIAVTVMRCCHLHLFPTAIAIATLIELHPEEWSHETHWMRHPRIGSIWISNSAYGLHIETNFGNWKPSTLERLIIRDAIDWRLHEYLRNRLHNEMNRQIVIGVSKE